MFLGDYSFLPARLNTSIIAEMLFVTGFVRSAKKSFESDPLTAKTFKFLQVITGCFVTTIPLRFFAYLLNYYN